MNLKQNLAMSIRRTTAIARTVYQFVASKNKDLSTSLEMTMLRGQRSEILLFALCHPERSVAKTKDLLNEIYDIQRNHRQRRPKRGQHLVVP